MLSAKSASMRLRAIHARDSFADRTSELTSLKLYYTIERPTGDHRSRASRSHSDAE
ncbi:MULTISPECIES: hypothetical protein [unclassified Microcoleus]|jgi:hypothetical protein|uniref:hypothetical protein n=1 Tax=unclassified Microcoleus TaxID=2642155 RepID=UPI001D20A6EC|nr:MULTISPECIES: hypothetical protein [unclassified Microcoleus]MCC3506436.1 hypothetical protein [Microcoleus sp. PH2017_19_SFW_U_A]MCC3412741.1 hypothetical protein [Microcoleus sp. PH2017_02_FOX_O_A]MCC3426419.1 hypothetical protein [Microcoleus sp. PH2017_01_SCD_O_A]MCC3437295.1 hypothetical protein [Microcoleus sp. PH2017_05_CCC_O_A]MCC3451374.1 hypothetical protein [Microcoleus sp. PH2017_09_SFU_O_A]